MDIWLIELGSGKGHTKDSIQYVVFSACWSCSIYLRSTNLLDSQLSLCGKTIEDAAIDFNADCRIESYVARCVNQLADMKFNNKTDQMGLGRYLEERGERGGTEYRLPDLKRWMSL